MAVAKNEKSRQGTKITESDFCHLGKQKSKPPTQSWEAIEYAYAIHKNSKIPPTHWEFIKKSYQK